MLVWLIQVAIISLVLIFLVHHLFTFFKTTLTVPKVRDVVSGQNDKYGKILDTLSQDNQSYTDIELLPTEQINGLTASMSNTGNSTMKNELKTFLRKQLSRTE
jgi:hypothetical protein